MFFMRSFAVIAAAAALFISSCTPGSAEKNNPYKALNLTTKSQEFVTKGNTFSFEFIDRINSSSDKDYIISPLSMQFLLGMILNGARGETEAEICSVLGYGKGEVAEVNEYCLSMLQQLPEMDKKTTLNIANAIFVDEGWALLPDYKSTVSRYFDAEVSNIPFADSEKSLKIMNGWCSDKTNGMIPKVLDRVSTDMLAYLFNAMYFKSQWKNKFQKSSTEEETFTDESGKESKVQMMKQNERLEYTENDVFKMVRMPYGNGAFSMYAFLPMEGKSVADIAPFLKEKDWSNYRWEETMTCQVDLWLPKFETKYRIKLNDILSEMGMPSAFDEGKADFKAMSDDALCLSYVQQDAVIKVDEEGTEAAVVSHAGMVKETAFMPGDPVDFHADHPFLYLIAENSTGAVLFAGRYSAK